MTSSHAVKALLVVLVLAGTATSTLAQYPVPDDALVIVATDSRYTQPIERLTPLPEGMREVGWRPYSLPGYAISHLSVAQGPLNNDCPPANAPPVLTKVTDLEQTRHYVYLRYQNIVQAQLKGAQDKLVQYTPEDADSFVTASPARFSYPGCEVYLGYVDGDTVEVIVDDELKNLEGNEYVSGYSTYDALLIRTQAQEEARARQFRAEIAAELARVRGQLSRAAQALASPLTASAAFDAWRAQLKLLQQQAREAAQALGAAGDPHALNLARRAVAHLARQVYFRPARRYAGHPISGLWSDAGLNAEQMRAWAQARALPLDSDGDGVVIFRCSTITEGPGFTYLPEPEEVGRPLRTFACRGQYEPVSFAVFATRYLPGVKVTAGKLRSGSDVLPQSAIDVKVVAVAWVPWGRVPEQQYMEGQLLVNDASLVTPELDEPVNHHPDREYVRDASSLRAVDIPAGTQRQFWVTIHVPDDQPAGTYTGKLHVRTADGRRTEVPLTVEVMAFDLPEPMLDYGFYYNSSMGNTDAEAWQMGDRRTRGQIRAELQSLLAHGVRYPAIYSGPVEFREWLKMMKEVGMPTDRVFWVSYPSSPEKVRTAVSTAREEGFGDVYFYLHDEASDDVRRKEIADCEMTHENGGKTFVADNHGNALRILRELLDLPNLAPTIRGDGAIAYYHGIGYKCYTYMGPNAEGTAEMFRRNYGFGLWQMGYDGAMVWAWNWGGRWRSADGAPWKRPLMQMRSVDGFIDTIKAQGWLAAVNDVRYLTALLEAIEQAEAGGFTQEAAAAERYVEELRDVLPWDFQGIRREIAQRTAALHELLP